MHGIISTQSKLPNRSIHRPVQRCGLRRGLRRLASHFALVLSLSVLASACAYHAGSGDRQIPGGYRTVAIPVFKNLTQEAGVEVFFTNALIRELERSQIGRVSEKSDSQVTLEGAISNIRYLGSNTIQGRGAQGQSLLPRDTILNAQYRILVDVNLKLVRNSDQKVLWQGSFSKESEYLTPRIGAVGPLDPTDLADAKRYDGLTSANALYNYSARFQSIRVMAADMMIEAHDRLTEKF